MAERVGIYGGTFDPIHVGHLAIAEEARWALELDRLYLVPAAQQPLKADRHAASPDQRLAMARLACDSNPALIVSDLELRRPPPSYTVDTLLAFQKLLGADVELFFILGADAVADLPRWRRAADLIRLAHLAIIGRPGYSVDLTALEAALPGLGDRIRLIDGLRLDISSSDLRARLATGRPVRYQIPDSVIAYIQQYRLYQ